MFALAIDLLAGRYVATAYNDRAAAEWPPHPARLFSALVATWAEGAPSSSAASELEALRWLERQAAPEILAAATAARRDAPPVFVPVNDIAVVSAPSRDKLDAALHELSTASDAKARAKAEKAAEKARKKLVDDTAKAIAAPTKVSNTDVANAVHVFPEQRTRQPRTFPSVTPTAATFAVVWAESEPTQAHRVALAGLCARIVRLGHSSSFVHVRLADDQAIHALRDRLSSFVPDDLNGELVIRWVGPGQVDRLTTAFESHRETEPRVLPARFVRYGDGARRPQRETTPRSHFSDEWIVFARVGGPRLPSTAVAGISRQFRRALMAAADQPVAQILSGHEADGGPSAQAHLAVVPLPFVGAKFADGAVLGLALVLPTTATPKDRDAVLRAVGKLERENVDGQTDPPVIPLRLGEAGVLELQRVDWGEPRNATLRASVWSHRARRWATASPVALDRNPGDLHDARPERRALAFREATASVVDAVQRIGLPSPLEVDVVRSCVLPGTAKPVKFPRFPADSTRTQRVLVHVRLAFAEPVRGPIVIGAGRFHGLGLFRPVEIDTEEPR